MSQFKKTFTEGYKTYATFGASDYKEGKAPYSSSAEAFGEALAPPLPEIPALPKLPTATDPEIEAARKRQREAEKLRQGRRTLMLTGGKGVTEPLGSVGRPEARAATVLGG